MLSEIRTTRSIYVGGALDPPHVGEPTHIDEAGLSVEERLYLCETIVTAEPPIGDAVVWMVYASARLSQVYLQKGPVEFYDHGIWSAVVAGSWPGNPGWTQPPELAHPFSSLFFHGL